MKSGCWQRGIHKIGKIVHVSVRMSANQFQFLQSYHKMSIIKFAWYVLRVKNMHPGSPSDPSGTAAAEAKPRCVYSILKPHGQSSRCQVRLLPPRCVYSNLKSHGQSCITSPESVQSSCVHQHTQDVPLKRVLPSSINRNLMIPSSLFQDIFLD